MTISPQVEAGPVVLQCVGSPKLGRYAGAATAVGKCSFVVHQQLHLQVPITITTVAQARPGNTSCEVPQPEGPSCDGEQTGPVR